MDASPLGFDQLWACSLKVLTESKALPTPRSEGHTPSIATH